MPFRRPRTPPVRVRIDHALCTRGDTVFIPRLGYNGTIIRFTRSHVIVLPHDFGPCIWILPRHLRAGSGVTQWQRGYLSSLSVPVNDPVVLPLRVRPHPSRRADRLLQDSVWCDLEELTMN